MAEAAIAETAIAATTLVQTTSDKEVDFQTRIARFTDQVRGVTVTDDETAQQATDLGKAMAGLKKAVEADRKDLVEGLVSTKKKIDDKYKGFQAGIDAAIDALKGVLLPYLAEKRRAAEEEARQEEERRREEERQHRETQRRLQEQREREEAERREEQHQRDLAASAALEPEAQIAEVARIDAEAAAEAERPAPEPEPAHKPAPKAKAAIVRGDGGGTSGTVKRWTYEVEDQAQIPRHFLVIDAPAVRQAICDGVREIDGVRIFQTEDLRIR